MFKSCLTVSAICCALVATSVNAAHPLMPTPLSVAITVGQWVYQNSTKEKLYYIRVKGSGANETQARQAGFKLAVEYAIGSLVLAESEVVNRNVSRDEIISYSSGYVDNFKVLESYTDNGSTVVEMDVWVKGSQIANRLLGRSTNTTEVDGSQLDAQLQTLNYERIAGDRVVKAVLADYPQRAYTVKTTAIDSMFSPDRSLTLNVKFSIAWDFNYVESLRIALEQTAQNRNAQCRPTCSHAFIATITTKDPGSFLSFETKSVLGFDDYQRHAVITQGLYGSRPAVQVKVISTSGRVMQQQCYFTSAMAPADEYNRPASKFVHIDQQRVIINGRNVFNGAASLHVPAQVENVAQVLVAVINGNQCSR